MIFHPRYQPTRSNILELAAEYLRMPYKGGTAANADREMEEAGERLANDPSDLEAMRTIVKWKSPRRMDRFKLNSAEKVGAAVKEAIEATRSGDVRRAVKALTKLAGVKVKMASAILTAMFPTLYTICDFRASDALGQEDFSSLRYYIEYLRACRRLAAQYGVSLRDFDRANWQWSKKYGKSSKKVKCRARAAQASAGYSKQVARELLIASLPCVNPQARTANQDLHSPQNGVFEQD